MECDWRKVGVICEPTIPSSLPVTLLYTNRLSDTISATAGSSYLMTKYCSIPPHTSHSRMTGNESNWINSGNDCKCAGSVTAAAFLLCNLWLDQFQTEKVFTICQKPWELQKKDIIRRKGDKFKEEEVSVGLFNFCLKNIRFMAYLLWSHYSIHREHDTLVGNLT